MIVTLTGMPDGKDMAYETGFHYFIDHVKLRIAEHVPPNVTPNEGHMPVNIMPTEREITFRFWRQFGETLHYKAEVSNVF